MHADEGDVASTLGSVRYRLGPRLQDARIDLHWDVSRLPLMTGWSARESHQMQMLLFEAFANMMTHSAATRASLHARWVPVGGADGATGEAIVVELCDNGRGFDANAKFAGRGLASMRARAAALGGTLTLRSRPGETSLCLHLPVPGSKPREAAVLLPIVASGGMPVTLRDRPLD